jgi:hypothetical protein
VNTGSYPKRFQRSIGDSCALATAKMDKSSVKSESDEVAKTRRELEQLKASLEKAMKEENNQEDGSDVEEESETGRNWKVDADVIISPIANTGPFHLEDSDASAGSPPAARSNLNASGTLHA